MLRQLVATACKCPYCIRIIKHILVSIILLTFCCLELFNRKSKICFSFSTHLFTFSLQTFDAQLIIKKHTKVFYYFRIYLYSSSKNFRYVCLYIYNAYVAIYHCYVKSLHCSMFLNSLHCLYFAYLVFISGLCH